MLSEMHHLLQARQGKAVHSCSCSKPVHAPLPPNVGASVIMEWPLCCDLIRLPVFGAMCQDNLHLVYFNRVVRT
jgi:hypothetical protein